MTLQVENISKSFGLQKVLSGVSFTVQAGETVGLLGCNGAGKTTLLRIITGLVQPDAGRVLFEGHPLTPAAMAAIGYLPEERGLYRHMKALDQALYFACLKGMSRHDARQALHQWFERLGMEGWENREAGHLSKGMQQKLQFAVTVVHGPRLLILDEPFSGFDTGNADLLKREIACLRSQGTAILFSTHNMQAASELCDKTISL